MAPQPPIFDRELRARLALGDAEFARYLAAVYEAIPPRPFDATAYDRALAYPWERPAGSFLYRDGVTVLLTDLPAAPLGEALESFAGPSSGRLPVLAIGSNAAPAALRRKLRHFEDDEDRELLVVTGRLHDFDVGAAASLAIYGALPATLFPSPGTEVAAAILWVTPNQFTQLTWSEVSYSVGRLEARFDPDLGPALSAVTAFVSRFGAFGIDGAHVALDAVPARGRTADARTQEEILAAAAALVLGPGVSPEALVRAIYEDPGGTHELVARTVRRAGLPFASERWRELI